jgi:hypothetical protein
MFGWSHLRLVPNCRLIMAPAKAIEGSLKANSRIGRGSPSDHLTDFLIS